MQKILALAGDFYHGADYLREGLEGILKDKYSLDIKDNYREIPWQELEEYDVFILACSGKLNPNDEIWITTEEEEFIDNYVSSGGKLLVLHCGLADFSTEGILRQVVKGHFLEHPEEHPEILVSPVKNDLFPVEEIEEFKIVDELYIVDVDLEDTTVFLQAESEDTQCYSWLGSSIWTRKGVLFNSWPYSGSVERGNDGKINYKGSGMVNHY